MLDVLNDYLKDAVTPELRMALESAHATFERIGLTNYNEGFEQILMLDDETDMGGTATEIVDLTKKLLNSLLRQHDVIVGEEISLENMTVILQAILDVQDYEVKDDLVRITTMDANPQEKLAELIALVSPLSVEELLLDIENVGPTLITRIREMAEAVAIEGDVEEITRTEEFVKRYVALQNFFGNPKLTITQMLTGGLNVGYPFITYAEMIGRDFEEMAPERAAQELLSIAFVSSDGFENPRSIIQSNIDHFIADINKITKIDIKVGDYLLGLQR